MPHRKKIVWRSPQICRDALDDAVLMGCDEQQFRGVLAGLIASLKDPYPLQK